jgi:predicted DNA-binding transcriptional regulator YafY
MRADRLLSTLMYLQTRGRATTGRLAQEFEVSRRTITRDLYALRVAGFPVYTERGAGGGVSLHEGFRMRLTDLTRDELEALFALSVSAPLADLGMGVEAKGAMLKLAAAMPASRSDVEGDVRNRIHLDPHDWDSSREALTILPGLRQAVWENRWARVTFLRARRVPVERDIAPHGLVAKGTAWYIVWRSRDGGMQVSRVAAVLDAIILDETFGREDGFDLEDFWTAWGRDYEASRGSLQVKAKASTNAIEQLTYGLAQHIDLVHAEGADGESREITLSFDSLEQARGCLLAYGSAIKVLEPKALRLSIEDFAEQICSMYRG